MKRFDNPAPKERLAEVISHSNVPGNATRLISR